MKQQNGFSIIEAVIAMGILATGLLGMAGLFTLGVTQMATSSANLVAREKAREAVESVHTARDTRSIVWCQIWNKGEDAPPQCPTETVGVFLKEFQPMYKAGKDGLVGTNDDAAAGLEEMVAPGPDGILDLPETPLTQESTDDVHSSLSGFRRKIVISKLKAPDGTDMANLRQIVVTIEYSVGNINRTYTLTTYISSIS